MLEVSLFQYLSAKKNLALMGSHGIQVTGAVLTQGKFEMRGNADIQWCLDLIRSVFNEFGSPPGEIASWKED
ncbi:MAG: hypothetical protein ACMUIP_04170 [bacterium]